MKLLSQLFAVALLSSLVLASGCDKLKGQAEQQETEPQVEATAAPAESEQAAVVDGQQAAPAAQAPAAQAQQAPKADKK